MNAVRSLCLRDPAVPIWRI